MIPILVSRDHLTHGTLLAPIVVEAVSAALLLAGYVVELAQELIYRSPPRPAGSIRVNGPDVSPARGIVRGSVVVIGD